MYLAGDQCLVKPKSRNSTTLVAVATLSGRAYYRITSLLKEAGISFRSLIPGTEVPPGVSVVLTTQSEKKAIQLLRWKNLTILAV